MFADSHVWDGRSVEMVYFANFGEAYTDNICFHSGRIIPYPLLYAEGLNMTVEFHLNLQSQCLTNGRIVCYDIILIGEIFNKILYLINSTISFIILSLIFGRFVA